MYCVQSVTSIGAVSVSKQHLFTLFLFVFIVKISHCKEKKKKPSADTVNDRKDSPEV